MQLASVRDMSIHMKRTAKKSKIKYVIHPGRFVGLNKQHYHVDFNDVVKLFDLLVKQCVHYKPGETYPDNWEHMKPERKHLP